MGKIYRVEVQLVSRHYRTLDQAFTKARHLAEISDWGVEIRVMRRLTRTTACRTNVAAVLDGKPVSGRIPTVTIEDDEVLLRMLGTRKLAGDPDYSASLRRTSLRREGFPV